MPSKSKAQQRLMGAAYAAKKNKTPIKELSPELQKIVKSMNKTQLKEFAKTKTKTNNLPEHSKSAFAVFAKQAMCGSKNCASSKMNNKNDDCCVKDKKVEKAGAKVKIVESLGGTKPVKTSKKATALNLKQYALKKKAARDPLDEIDDSIGSEVWGNRNDKAKNWINKNIKKPVSAGIGAVGDGVGGLGNGTYTETRNGPTRAEMNKMIEEDEAQENAKREQEMADQAAKETAQSAEEWNNRPWSEKLYERLSDIYSKHGRGINAAGAGLGTYGLARLLGGGNTLSSILGLGTGGLTYALQDKNTREQLMNWLKSITDGFKKTSSVKNINQEHWLLKLAKKHNGRTKGAFGKNPGRQARNAVNKVIRKSSLGKKLALLLGTALPTATAATVGKNIYDNKKEEERIQNEREAQKREQEMADQAAKETAQSAEEWNNRPLSEKLYDMYKNNDQMINSAGAGIGTYGLTRLLGGSNLLGGVLGAGAGGLTYAAHDPKIRKAVKDLLNINTMVSGQALPVHPIETLMSRTSGSLKDALVDLGGYIKGNEQLKNMPKVLATAFTPTFSINGKDV